MGVQRKRFSHEVVGVKDGFFFEIVYFGASICLRYCSTVVMYFLSKLPTGLFS